MNGYRPCAIADRWLPSWCATTMAPVAPSTYASAASARCAIASAISAVAANTAITSREPRSARPDRVIAALDLAHPDVSRRVVTGARPDGPRALPRLRNGDPTSRRHLVDPLLEGLVRRARLAPRREDAHVEE